MTDDNGLDRVRWFLYWCLLGFIAGLVAYSCAGCSPRVPAKQPLVAPPPAYGNKVV